MDPKKVQLIELLKKYDKIQDLFAETYEEFSRLRDCTKANTFNLEEYVNRIFIVRKMSEFLVDLRKEADGVIELMERQCCALWVLKHTNDPAGTEPIRAEFATGSPKTGLRANIPKLDKDPERFLALMKFFGMSEEQARLNVIRPHWPAMKTYLTELSQEGKPLPDGIKPTDAYPTYSIVTRMRRDLDQIMEEIKEAKNDDEKIEEILDRRE